MKSTIYLLAAFLLAGCTDQQESTTLDKPLVFVSIMPQAGLAKTIAGDLIDIQTLVGAGQTPHAYEPTARQLVQLGKASALITIGVPFERRLLQKIEPLYPDLAVIESQRGVTLLAMSHAHHEGECSHAHGEYDPHIWLSPTNLILIAQNLCQTFEQIDPSNTETYRENSERLVQQLKQLDANNRLKLAACSGSRIYVFHPSFGYFCEAYELKQIAVEVDGKSPSPRQLSNLIEQARSDGVKVLFVQKQFPADSATAIAQAIDGIVIPLDPLAEDSIANLQLIADSIASALKK
jgi:zinc transport system substrate-binding protein